MKEENNIEQKTSVNLESTSPLIGEAPAATEMLKPVEEEQNTVYYSITMVPGPKTSSEPKTRKHRIIQVIVWLLFLGVCDLSIRLGGYFQFPVYNIILVDSIFAAIAIAVTCSQAYNHTVSKDEPPIWNKAEREKAMWRHANYCWQIISIWLTVAPLYCTCIAIYLSGNNKNPEDVMIHSILSLVISLSVYAISPSSRASAFRKAYALANDALMGYELDPKNGRELLRKAMDAGTRITIEAEDGTKL